MRSLLALPLLLAACTSSGSPSSDDFIAACLDATNWERPVCTCAEEQASETLSERTYAFVVATLREDPDEIARLRADLTFAEATEAGFFMVNAATACATP